MPFLPPCLHFSFLSHSLSSATPFSSPLSSANPQLIIGVSTRFCVPPAESVTTDKADHRLFITCCLPAHCLHPKPPLEYPSHLACSLKSLSFSIFVGVCTFISLSKRLSSISDAHRWRMFPHFSAPAGYWCRYFSWAPVMCGGDPGEMWWDEVQWNGTDWGRMRQDRKKVVDFWRYVWVWIRVWRGGGDRVVILRGQFGMIWRARKE